MLEHIHEKVDVIAIYKRIGVKVYPAKVRWNGKDYIIQKLGYTHREKIGGTVHHIFHVSSDSYYFRLRFDTFNLSWLLEEVSDGLAT
jgi:hypothetical protein